MQKVTWEIEHLSPPAAIKYCKKCAKKTDHVCSDLFRVNAQKKNLDIWLIYKCTHCDSTWNLTLYSRITPDRISRTKLEQFHCNDPELVKVYAMDTDLLQRCGAEVKLPDYKIVGPNIELGVTAELRIKSKYPLGIKVSTLLRERLMLSRKAFEDLLEKGLIQGPENLDLKKCKLHGELLLSLKKEAL